jgi:hypothetical protein
MYLSLRIASSDATAAERIIGQTSFSVSLNARPGWRGTEKFNNVIRLGCTLYLGGAEKFTHVVGLRYIDIGDWNVNSIRKNPNRAIATATFRNLSISIFFDYQNVQLEDGLFAQIF